MNGLVLAAAGAALVLGMMLFLFPELLLFLAMLSAAMVGACAGTRPSGGRFAC